MQKQLALKAAVIFFLSLFLLIPLNLISSQVRERGDFLRVAQNDIASSWTGEQTLMTPVIVQPYLEAPAREGGEPKLRQQLLATTHVQILLDARAQERARGIYRVPVYTADVMITGRMDNREWQRQRTALKAQDGVIRLLDPYMAVALSDQRGIEKTIAIQLNELTAKALPGTGIGALPEGFRFALPASDEVDGETPFAIQFSMRGMLRLGLLPAATNVNVRVHSTWPHPKFDGAFLPNEKNITASGFSAGWSVNEFNSNSATKLRSCESSDCSALKNTAFHVELFQPVNVYLQTERAVKYGILFIAICFAAFFIFENISELKIHPIQYGLVGMALAIFYLLLLALSEHLPFFAAYLIAAGACCLLLLEYLSAMLGDRKRAVVFSGCIAALYAKLFVILQMEDYALLMGALLLFCLLAILMLTTRKINWYRSEPAPQGELFTGVN